MAEQHVESPTDALMEAESPVLLTPVQPEPWEMDGTTYFLPIVAPVPRYAGPVPFMHEQAFHGWMGDTQSKAESLVQSLVESPQPIVPIPTGPLTSNPEVSQGGGVKAISGLEEKGSNSRMTAPPEMAPIAENRLTTNHDEFPYRPSKNQRSGHARRISVAIKSKESLGMSGM